MTAGEKIKEARQRLGWTQPELAERMGVKREDVSKIETGYVGLGPDRARRVAEIEELGLTLPELLEGEDPATVHWRREIQALRARVEALEAALAAKDTPRPQTEEPRRRAR